MNKFKSRLSFIVRVNEVLNRTVVVAHALSLLSEKIPLWAFGQMTKQTEFGVESTYIIFTVCRGSFLSFKFR